MVDSSLPVIDVEDTTGESLLIRFLPLSYVVKNIGSLLFDRNSKRHDTDALYKSIRRYGFIDPPKYDTKLNGGKGGIVYGNGRLEVFTYLLDDKAAGKEPPKGIPVSNVDGDWLIPIKFGVDCEKESEARALAIDHNNLTMSGGDFTAEDMAKMWDLPEYVGLLKDLADQETLAITVDEENLASLLLDLAGDNSIEESEKDLEELEESIEDDDYEGRVQPGEIWKLGRHYIACGDCCEESNIDKLVSYVDGVQMVWADPPYGISIVATNGFVGGSKPFGSADVRGSDGSSNVVKVNKYYPIAGDDSTDTAINSTSAYLSAFPDAVHCWWGGNHFADSLPPSSCWIVWDKENTGWFADAELAWTNQPSAVRIFKHMWNGMVKASEHGQKRVHPTQKPIALASWFFEKYGKANDTIIDPFLGSGMSLIAAEQLGDQTVIGFELSDKYCSIICDRWEKLTGGTAKKIGELP